MCHCNEDGRTRSHVDNFVIVSGGLKRKIGSKEVGVVCEESNVMHSDEYTEEFQNDAGRISVVGIDPRLLRESRLTDIDFANQLGVYLNERTSDTRDCARKNSNGRVLTSSV